MSTHCNRYPGCGCPEEIGTKCYLPESEKLNGVIRSEIHKSILEIIIKLPLKKVEYDCLDPISAACEIEKLIQQPVSAMEDGWVKVEDGYPTPADGDKDGNVLGWDKFQNKCHKCSIIDIAQMKLRFTHWRPLPPPPSK